MKKDTTRLVQLQHASGRHIALVNEPDLLLINNFHSVYDLVLKAIDSQTPVKDLIGSNVSDTKLNYDDIYTGKNEWKLLPAFDHPENPLHCMVSGTGLTHKNSALNRQMMHKAVDDKPTDSMQMYQWGLEGGNPASGEIGIQPEWFYKGNGTMLKAHGESLEVPAYANDGGEEPEIAGIYVVDKEGNPYRVGFCTANEFSDHVMEKKNYLYLAPSKLRQSAIGPELVIDGDFTGFTGTVGIHRNNETIWQSAINSGESNMAHNLTNLEYHHFKYEGHRVPLQAHVHYFGADAFSFGSKLMLQDNDIMSVEWDGMGRALKNHLKVIPETEKLVEIRTI
jgi:hypothetical protein